MGGSVVWGHTTGDEENKRTFQNNWSGGTISGSGDTEKLQLVTDEMSISEMWFGGIDTLTIERDKYRTGYGEIVIYYKTGADPTECDNDTWHVFNQKFDCLGYYRIAVEAVS